MTYPLWSSHSPWAALRCLGSASPRSPRSRCCSEATQTPAITSHVHFDFVIIVLFLLITALAATLTTLKSGEPQSAFVRALSVSLSAQTEKERRLAIHVIQSYLRDNETAQVSIANALAEKRGEEEREGEAETLQELIDVVAQWNPSPEDFIKLHSAYLILAAIVGGCGASKAALFGIQVALPPPSEGFGVRCLRHLAQAIRVKASNTLIIALLRFLVTWIADSPLVVSAFLQVSSLNELCSEVVASPSSNLHVAGLVALLLGMVLLSQSNSTQPFPTILERSLGVERLTKAISAVVASDDFQAAEASRVRNLIK